MDDRMDDRFRIMARWDALIGEHETFLAAVRAHTRLPHWPGVAPHIAMLKAEAAVSERAVQAAAAADGAMPFELSQALTNIAARESMWRIIKTSRGGVLALARRFPKAKADGTKGKYARHASASGQKADGARAGASKDGRGVFVNAVVDDGREWLRVLTTTTEQLLVGMAENGWPWGEENDDDDDDENDTLDEIREIPLVEAVLDLVDAAVANRTRGSYPRICVVLPRVDERDDRPDDGRRNTRAGRAEVRRFLRCLEQGVAARCTAMPRDIDGRTPTVTVHTAMSERATAVCHEPFDTVLTRLLPAVAHALTPTLNIDTSILVALASDLSHQLVAVEAWFPTQRVDEIAHERRAPGAMLRSLCTAMQGRRLACTREAAAAFRSMVASMGQPTEQQRAAVLLSESDDPNESDRVQAYRALSTHADAIPDDLLLPIRVIDEDWNLDTIALKAATGGTGLPAAALAIAQDMRASAPTLSVFFYGWASGHTTLTTNSTARNKVARFLERRRTHSDETGPRIWLSRPVRSLNGTNPNALLE